MESKDYTGSHPCVAVLNAAVCLCLPQTAMQPAVAQVGRKPLCALKRSLTGVSLPGVLLFHRPRGVHTDLWRLNLFLVTVVPREGGSGL